MFRRLLPVETSFFDFFDEHAAVLVRATDEFLAFVSQPRLPEPGMARCKVDVIKEMEHEADAITHRCIAALRRTFITPIDRDEIHRLIRRLDDIMDELDSAADRLALYEITEVKPGCRELAEVLSRASRVLVTALQELRSEQKAEKIQQCCVEIHRLENEGDSIMARSLARMAGAGR